MFAKWSICPCRWTICPAITFWSTTFTSSPPHAGEAASKAELAEIDDGGHVSVSIAKFSAPAIVWRWYVRCTTRAIVTTEPSGYTIESIDETGRRPPRRSGRLPRGTLSDEQILEAAGELAASRGIDAFTMPDVAKRLGVKVTSVYWYFRTRDDLVLALADRATREFYEGLDYDGDLEGDDRVLEHFFLYWRRLRANRLWREVFIHSVRRTIGRSAEVQAQREPRLEFGCQSDCRCRPDPSGGAQGLYGSVGLHEGLCSGAAVPGRGGCRRRSGTWRGGPRLSPGSRADDTA